MRGNAKGTKSCVYLTVGTGVGGGVIINGEILNNYGHPEMGHLLIRAHKDDDFTGTCPYHNNCLEGLAAGPAIEARFQKKAQLLQKDHPYWKIEADYLAQALVAYTLILRPEVIILGGGVMKQKHLFPMIREEFNKYLQDYVHVPNLSDYIREPGLQDNAGIMGCLLLAERSQHN